MRVRGSQSVRMIDRKRNQLHRVLLHADTIDDILRVRDIGPVGEDRALRLAGRPG